MLAEIFEYLEEKQAGEYLSEMDIHKAAELIAELDTDTAVNILAETDKDRRSLILEAVEPAIRTELRLIASFDDDEIGSRMTTNCIIIGEDMSVKQAMNALVSQARKNDNISTLFVDDENKLLGVITAQNIIEASDDEMGEDYAKLGGLSAEEDLNEPVLASVKKRLPWLLILLGLGMVVSRAVACCNYPCSCGSLLRHKLDIPAERPPSLIKIHAKKDPHCKKYGSIFICERTIK